MIYSCPYCKNSGQVFLSRHNLYDHIRASYNLDSCDELKTVVMWLKTWIDTGMFECRCRVLDRRTMLLKAVVEVLAMDEVPR
jgi:hypothetical protein